MKRAGSGVEPCGNSQKRRRSCHLRHALVPFSGCGVVVGRLTGSRFRRMSECSPCVACMSWVSPGLQEGFVSVVYASPDRRALLSGATKASAPRVRGREVECRAFHKEEATMADRIDQQLSNYRLVSLLGQGGYAEV